MQLNTKKHTKLTVNLTSLIDVLFILIIFFAVSSTFLEQPGIELKLPEAESSESYTSQKIIIYVDKGENMFLNDQLVTTNTMISEIKKLGELSPDGSLVLKADSKVPHGKIIEVMDLLRKNGMYKIVISTNYPE